MWEDNRGWYFSLDYLQIIVMFLSAVWTLIMTALVLGGMTKNLYHGIFQNYTGFTVYDGIYFFDAWPGVNLIFYWLREEKLQ